MHPIYTILIFAFTIISLVLISLKVRIFYVLGAFLIGSQLLCLVDIFMRQPAQVVWLCNVTVFMNIFLLFKFNQRLFDLFFYYTWLGCFFICLMPNNFYSNAVKDLPIVWMAYWIKHIIPLLMTFYFFVVQKRRLSTWSVYTGVVGFLAYCLAIYGYNLFFNENILYLMKPAAFMEPLGKHYFLISICMGYFWVAILQVGTSLMGWVKKSPSGESASKSTDTSGSIEASED